jgi:hypothetical protein
LRPVNSLAGKIAPFAAAGETALDGRSISEKTAEIARARGGSQPRLLFQRLARFSQKISSSAHPILTPAEVG